MRGFVLRINEKCISGAIEEGITSVIVTWKENRCHIHFGSMSKNGMVSYIWYVSDMKISDCFNVDFKEINDVSEAEGIRNYNKLQDVNEQKNDLELYFKLKKELIGEGMISEHEI
jgi:coenzyme F420-reducing hydrogenase delta subunit